MNKVKHTPPALRKSQSQLFGKLDSVFAIIFFAYILAGPAARELGAATFILMVALAGFYCLLRRFSWIPSLFALTILVVIYIIYSLLHSLPKSWTLYFDTNVLWQQVAGLLSLYFFVSAFKEMWIRLFNSRHIYKVATLMVIAPALTFPLIMDDRGDSFLQVFSVPNLINSMMVFMIGISILLYRIKLNTFGVSLVVVVTTILVMASANSQTLLAAILLMMVLAIPKPHMVSVGVLVVMLLLMAILPFLNVRDLNISDPNTALRMFIWLDVFRAVADTAGIGVGFGTEATKNYYVMHSATSPFTDENLMLISTHNSFMFVAFRMGILGVILFCIFCLQCSPHIIKSKRMERLGIFAWTLAMLSLYVNVGLESPLFVIGIAFAFSLGLAVQELNKVGRSPYSLK